jgi:Zn-dependent metalloprotease
MDKSISEKRRFPLIPPYILNRLAQSKDEKVRRAAVEMIASASAMRAVRSVLATMPIMAAIPSIARKKERLIYDMKHSTSRLPGALVLREGSSPAKNKEIREAYANLGFTFDFYEKVFRRNSLDNNGMSLIASVHYGRGYNNAFWNGEQMVFGDGDGKIFVAFTRSLDVVAHELSHGVVTHTCNLDYQDQSGALNEHFADVFGALTEQWRLGQTAGKASWLIGAEIMGPKTKAKAIRTFKAEKAFENDPILGTDPQPKHMKDFYAGADDDGGVHINSGIPNNAFYRAAAALGGKAWETVGPIWYKTLSRLNRESDFVEAAKTTIEIARCDCGANSREAAAVKDAWKAVGVKV